ncbi:MAG: 3-deoxy-7-phosphoheptulonate synthase [Deltaproteobacteria bacterium]|nr:3-deoxy-7-phosphoheptulonate synthase [Deltaproteobacteria bacterium]
MLVVMEKKATREDIDLVVKAIEDYGWTARRIPGGERVSIGVLNNSGSVDASLFLGLPGVKDAIPVTCPYKNKTLTIIAGPCAVESEDQAMAIAETVKNAGAHIFRGGAFKPRTSPYSFQGLGEKGLEILAKVREKTGMPIITEVMDNETFDLVDAYTDIIQIGTRNMQNFSLLKRAGKARKPVLLKRGMAATIEEWLMAAEYILEAGNTEVILCERGVRTFVHHSRNTLDLSAVLAVRKESHLPIIVDPSHAAGRRDQVLPLSRAAVAANAHGLMVEVHHMPDKALSDGAQSLYPDQFAQLCIQVRSIFKISEISRLE